MLTQTIELPLLPPLESHALWDEIHTIQFDHREVLVVIDDFTRPKNAIARMVVQYAVSEVGEDKVAVVVASGLHRANTHHEVSEKIGPDLTKRLRIYNHSPLCNFPLNKERYNIIAVGCVIPHTFAGLSAGPKIVMPGLSSYEHVLAFHAGSRKEASDLVGSEKDAVNTYVNYTINSCGDPVRIFVYPSRINPGLFRYDSWMDYRVVLPDDLADAAILIPRFKNIDFQQSINALRVFIDSHNEGYYYLPVKENGVICISTPAPEGIGIHYGFQQPNGLKPAYYDDVYADIYDGKVICFVCPTVSLGAVQEYFRRPVFLFETMSQFTKFVDQRYGNTCSVTIYDASDIMIGVASE